MGKIALQIKANLTNVDAIYPESFADFNWILKVKCTGCDELNTNWHEITKSEQLETQHAAVNFLCKCKCCKVENNLTILETNQVNSKQKKSNAGVIHKEYTSEDDGQFITMIVFECRGMEPTDFMPGSGWAVRSGDKVFSDVEITDNEWCDYNDHSKQPVEINNFESQFVKIK